MQSAANPYQSPQQSGGESSQAVAPLARSISWRRGIAAAVIAGLLGAAVPMSSVMVFLVAIAPSPRHYVGSPVFIVEALRSSIVGVPFFLLFGMAALANYTPATRRGMSRMLLRQMLILLCGFALLLVLGAIVPEEYLDGIVGAFCLAASFVPMIVWGIYSTRRQIRLDRNTLGQ